MFNKLNPFSRRTTDDHPEFDQDHRIEIHCPKTMGLIATEDTDPDEWDSDVDDGEGIATYDCPECGEQHRYLWGPPVPLNVDEEESERSLFDGL
ncbi:hypothetical protein [Haladaptatus caseinilyticus]|uniref:hypothetical protein n=1 Tax=Haladaptatus caseinilyticus TaxID=2993314 RepID=UPI00224B217D|nr:hypothetical protein [Haladaptatus caseinilyticus]